MTDEESTDWFSDENATFGDRLAAAREAAGLTQKDLAKRLGVKPSTLDNWEQDLNEPRANRLQMLSGLLGVSMRWLLTGVGSGVTAPDEPLPDNASFSAILTDIRGLRTQMVQNGEKLALLEKRLRQLMQDAE